MLSSLPLKHLLILEILALFLQIPSQLCPVTFTGCIVWSAHSSLVQSPPWLIDFLSFFFFFFCITCGWSEDREMFALETTRFSAANNWSQKSREGPHGKKNLLSWSLKCRIRTDKSKLHWSKFQGSAWTSFTPFRLRQKWGRKLLLPRHSDLD